ncbi:MAG: CHAT domain-containing protein, partial [Thermodesulfobacteriota bacterium]
LEHYQQALRIAKEIGDKQGQGNSLGSIGLVYFSLGDYPKALEHCQQALKIAKEIGDKKGEGSDLGNIGIVYKNLGDYPKALEHHQQALKTFETLGTKSEIRITTGNIGDVHLEQGDLAQAEKWFQQAGGPIRLGRLALAKRDFPEAVKKFKNSLTEDEQSRNAEFLFADLIGLGLAHEGLQEYKEAKEYFQRAVTFIEDQRTSLTESQKTHFYEAKIHGFPRILAYQGLARVLEKLGDHEAGFRTSEGARARLLSEAFSRQGRAGAFNVPAALLQQESDLTTRIAGYRKMMEKLFEQKQMNRYAEIEKELAGQRKELEALVNRLRKEHPEYAAVKYPTPLAAGQLALQSEEVLLSFQVTDTGVIWYRVAGGRVAQSGWIEIAIKDLTRMVKDYRAAFEGVSGRKDLDKHDAGLSRKLFDLLLAPALASGQAGEKIVLVPDGVLGLLPFEALAMSTSPVKYAGDEYDLAYAHSGTSLTLARTLKKGGKPGRAMFVLADPVFDQKDARVQGQVQVAQRNEFQIQMMRAIAEPGVGLVRGLSFPRLAETGVLAQQLGKQFGGQTSVLSGLQATKAQLSKQPLDQFQYLVFATHGVLDKDAPYLKQPALVLTQVGTKNWLDGFFTLTEVMSTRMTCDVAALTACQTGLGRNVTGEGVMHLGRGFQYAGAKSVLVSLWSVAEESTTYLIERFFGRLKAGQLPRQALRQARQDLRAYKNGLYDHPFFWGAFILIGG